MATEPSDPADELVRLQVLQLRRSLSSQAETIIELGKAGFSNARIADLLGTTPATVKVTLQRSKKRAGPNSKTGDE
ncbi:MAG: sigma factor-like helix-turn-helix DNA-binding protein [Jatrophihabitantaceae bacterium]